MKLKIKTTTLLNGLNKVSNVIDNKNAIEGLTGIYLKAENNNLTLIGSDSSLTIKCVIDHDIEVYESGAVILPQVFTNFVSKISDEWLEFYVLDNHQGQIITSKSKFNLNGIDPYIYPTIDFSLSGDKLTLNTNDFKRIINETAYAVSVDELRPMLSGINFVCQNQTLTLAATNSFRLAQSILPINESIETNIIVTSKCLTTFKNIVGNLEQVDIYVSNQKILIDLGNVIIQSSLISGVYPNINNLIPTEFASTITFNKKELYNSLDIANLLAFKNNYIVTLKNEEDKLYLYTRSQELGSADEIVDFIKQEGEPIDVSFNSKYVIDALKVLDSEDIIMNFNGTMGPFVITSSDEANKSIQLVLPVKTHFN